MTRHHEAIIHPRDALRALDACARAWSPTHLQAYADALVRAGGYVQRDALDEAGHVGHLMTSGSLTPYLLCDGVEHLDALAGAIERDAQDSPTRPAIFVLGSGNTGLPLIINTVIGLVAGKTVFARPSRRNVDAIRAWLGVLDEVAGSDPVAQALRERIILLELDHDTAEYGKALARLPVHHAYLWGGAEAIRETAAVLPPEATRYCFGPRTGVVVIECAHWESLDDAAKGDLARATRDNLLRYDAALCSSPTLGIVIGERERARRVLDELAAAIEPEPGERDRLVRLPGANARRRDMRGWVSHGYSLHRGTGGSMVTLALGTLRDYHERNRYLPMGGTYHETAGSLELLCVSDEELADAATLIATLHDEPRYAGLLWGVGHLATIASQALTSRLLEAITEAQHVLARAAPCVPERLPASALRVVDLRDNLGREPGEPFDGIALLPSMLASP
jgi:hypothetical protein